MRRLLLFVATFFLFCSSSFWAFNISWSVITQTWVDTDISWLAAIPWVTTMTLGSWSDKITIYNLWNLRLVIQWTLSQNSEQEQIIFNNPANPIVDIQSGGTYNMWTDIIVNGNTRQSQGTAIYVASRDAGCCSSWNAVVNIQNGGTWNWKWSTIDVAQSPWFASPSSNVNITNGVLLVRRDATSDVVQVRQQSNNFVVDGLVFKGNGKGDITFLSRPQQMNRYAPQTVWWAMSFSSSTPNYDVTFRGYSGWWQWNEKDIKLWAWARPILINSKTGSDIRLWNHQNHWRSYWVALVYQELDLEVRDLANNPLEGVKFFIRDTDNGGREIYNQEWHLVDNIQDKVYSGSTSSTWSIETQSILLAANIANSWNGDAVNTGNYAWDYRWKNNNSSDLFDIHLWSYNHLHQVLSDTEMKWIDGTKVSAKLLPDTHITESDPSVVAGYASIDDLDQLYDYAKMYKLENLETWWIDNLIIDTVDGKMVLGDYNLHLDSAATEVFSLSWSTITIKTQDLAIGNQFTHLVTTWTITVEDTETYFLQWLNTNTAPSGSDVSLFKSEALSSGSFLGIISAVDNEWDNISYTITSWNSDGKFSIDSSWNLFLSGSLDYETQTLHTLNIRISDDGTPSLFSDIVAKINVTDSNLPPSDITLSTTTISNGSATGSSIATVSVVDDNEWWVVWLSLNCSNFTWADNPKFSLSWTLLSINELVDFASQQSYDICVKASDSAGSYEEKFTMFVSTANNTPSFTSFSWGVSGTIDVFEETYLITTLSAVDSDASQKLTFTISWWNDASHFSIWNTSGILRFVEPVDYESPIDSDGDNVYNLEVQVSDDGIPSKNDTQNITVNVKNKIVNPSSIYLSNQVVDENTATWWIIGDFTAIDIDNSTHNFSFASWIGDDDNNAFTLSWSQLLLAVSPDYEAQKIYSIRVMASDGEWGIREDSFTIFIKDIIDSPGDIILDSVEILENSATWTVVWQVQYVGPVPSLVLGCAWVDNGKFSINWSNELVSSEVFDFETKSFYQVCIESTVSWSTKNEEFIILIDNVNESPSITSTPITNVNRDTIYTYDLIGADVDTAESLSFSFASGATVPSFLTLQNTANGVGKIFWTPSLSDVGNYTIEIQLQDDEGLVDTQNYTLEVVDGTAAPSDITLSNTIVEENKNAGTLIGLFSTADTDSSNFTYSLVSGIASVDNTSFSITDNQLILQTSTDFETKKIYNIRVRTDDMTGNIFEKNFQISVSDTADGPNDVALSNNSILEWNISWAQIATIQWFGSQNGLYSYSLWCSGVDNASFSLSGTSLSLSEVANYENKPYYDICIEVSDGSYTYQKEFSILVKNTNDIPSITSTALTWATRWQNYVYNVLADDPDSADVLNFSFASGSDTPSWLTLSNISNGFAQLRGTPNISDLGTYTLKIQVNDSNGWSDIQNFTLTVVDSSLAPSDIVLSDNTVMENNASWALIGVLSSVDTDSSTHSYAFISWTWSADNNLFSLSWSSLFINEQADYETKYLYSVRIETTDDAGNTFEKSLNIYVKDILDGPNDIILSHYLTSENNAVPSMIGSLSGTGSSAWSYAFSLSCVWWDNSSFLITGNNLSLNSQSNYEQKNYYEICVQTTDGVYTFDKQFLILVSNENENPTFISTPVTIADINTLYSYTILWKDPDYNDTLTFSLLNSPSFLTLSNIWNNVAKLEWYPAVSQSWSHNVTIQATDSLWATSQQSFVLQVSNTTLPPTAIALSNNSLVENVPSWSLVWYFTTVDSDSSTFTYSLVFGTWSDDNSTFSLDGNILSIQVSPDFENKSEYKVRVQSSDESWNTISQEFIIHISDTIERTRTRTKTKIKEVIKYKTQKEYVYIGSARWTDYTLRNEVKSCSTIEKLLQMKYTKSTFSDTYTSYYFREIENFRQVWLVKWVSDTIFEPQRSITRAEFLAIVLKMHCHDYSDVDTTNLPFTDVDPQSWQAKVVAYAHNLGIISGYDGEEENLFKPDNIITKIELVKIAMNMWILESQKKDTSFYIDVYPMWQQEYVKKWEYLWIFNERSRNFKPNQEINREETIWILSRLLRLYK